MTQGSIAPSDIAEMAGVSRGAVSNWRASDRGFPQPVGGSEARPLFDVGQVAAWLTAHGYRIHTDRGERMVWSVLNRFRGPLPVETLIDLLLSVLTARRLSAESSALKAAWDQMFRNEPRDCVDQLRQLGAKASSEDASWSDLVVVPPDLEMMPAGSAIVSALLQAVDQLNVADLGHIADHALSRMAAAQARSAGEHGLVGSRVSTLLADSARVGRDQVVVYDPACGIGEVLIRAHQMISGGGRLVGHDINPAAVRLARQRCLLAGVDAELTVADVLHQDPDPTFRADVVVVEPPFNMRWELDYAFADPRWTFGLAPRSASETAWMQHAIYHLNAGGRAYVITGAGPTFRTGAERKIRTELLRQGCIETVVSLPGKMLPHTSIPLVLWVLCRPGQSNDPDSVLLIDASEVRAPETRVSDWLSFDARSAADLDDWAPHTRVALRDLLAGDSDVQPQRWLGQSRVDVAAVQARHRAALTALAESSAKLAITLAPPMNVPTDLPAPRMVSVKELGTVVKGRIQRDEKDDLAPFVVHARDVRTGLAHRDDAASEAQSQPDLGRHQLTQPGDILITAMNEVRAVVDHRGGHILGNGVYQLRVDPSLINPTFVAYYLTGSWNEKFQMGTTIKRANVNHLEVPLVPLDDQLRMVALLDRASESREQAAAAQSAATSVIAGLLDTVCYQARS